MFNDDYFGDIYNKNHLILKNKNTEYLLNLFLRGNNSFLKNIAKNIILEENRLEECYDIDDITKFVSCLSIEELWPCIRSENIILRKISQERMIYVLSEDDARFRRNLIHIVK